MSHVGAFATGIKLNQVIKALLGCRSKDKVTSELLKINNQEHAAAIWPLTLEVITLFAIRKLDCSHKHFYRWLISDYPVGVARLVMQGTLWSLISTHNSFHIPRELIWNGYFRALTSAVLWEGSSVGTGGFFWCEKHWPSLALGPLQHVGFRVWFRSIRVSSNWRQIQKETGLITWHINHNIKPRRQLRT